MEELTLTARPGAASAPSDARSPLTRALLAGGVLAGALFMVVSLIQAFTRPGFDVVKDPVSLLGLGDLGWIQVADFVGSGLLFVALAVGAWRVLHTGPAGTWGPLLIGGFGLGLIVAGVFRTDPALGFPPGTPPGSPASASWHAMLHGVGFLISFTSLTAACFVLARRFRALAQRRWALYSTATGVITPLLIVLGLVFLIAVGMPGIPFAAAGALGSWWVAAVAAKLAADSTRI